MVSQYSEERDEKQKEKETREIKGLERNPTLKLQAFPGRKTLGSEAISNNTGERKSGQMIFTSNKNIDLWHM